MTSSADSEGSAKGTDVLYGKTHVRSTIMLKCVSIKELYHMADIQFVPVCSVKFESECKCLIFFPCWYESN